MVRFHQRVPIRWYWPRVKSGQYQFGAVAKWERGGLQNRHRAGSIPARTSIKALVGQLDGQRISTPPHAGSSPAERANSSEGGQAGNATWIVRGDGSPAAAVSVKCQDDI